MKTKKRGKKKVVKLVTTKSDPVRYDFAEGFVIIGIPEGNCPEQETALLLLEKAKIVLLSDEIKTQVEEE